MTILRLQSQNIVLHLILTSTATMAWMALPGVKICGTILVIYKFIASMDSHQGSILKLRSPTEWPRRSFHKGQHYWNGRRKCKTQEAKYNVGSLESKHKWRVNIFILYPNNHICTWMRKCTQDFVFAIHILLVLTTWQEAEKIQYIGWPIKHCNQWSKKKWWTAILLQTLAITEKAGEEGEKDKWFPDGSNGKNTHVAVQVKEQHRLLISQYILH